MSKSKIRILEYIFRICPITNYDRYNFGFMILLIIKYIDIIYLIWFNTDSEKLCYKYLRRRG